MVFCSDMNAYGRAVLLGHILGHRTGKAGSLQLFSYPHISWVIHTLAY